MKHIGGVPNAGPSHIATMVSIGRELHKRGHRFTLFSTAAVSPRVAELGIEFYPLRTSGPDFIEKYRSEMTREEGVSPIRATREYMKASAEVLCSEGPGALTRSGIDFLLADQEEPGAATAADLGNIPYATICSSVPLNEEATMPPSFLDWPYATGPWARYRNWFSYRVRNFLFRSVHVVLNRYRKAAGLRRYHVPDDSFSKLAQITQLVREFDFPRRKPPQGFRYVGPFQRGNSKQIPFPWSELDERPLVYASLGTVQGGRLGLLKEIAAAIQEFDVQLAISLGGSARSSDHDALPGRPIVVQYAPQRELLERAALVITHAGLNTVLEALSQGVPIVALPITGDQLGVGARINYHGVGKTVAEKERGTTALRKTVGAVLGNSNYRIAAARVKDAISRTGGACEAAEIIEKLL